MKDLRVGRDSNDALMPAHQERSYEQSIYGWDTHVWGNQCVTLSP